MPVTVVFGTTNPGKLDDAKNLVDNSSVDIKNLVEIGVRPTVVKENGSTFEENALIKYDALHPLVSKEYVLVTEDSGLEIDALNGKPGVHSRRWEPGGKEMSDKEALDKVLVLMKDQKNRTARFVSVIAFGGHGLARQTIRGELVGTLLEEPDMRGFLPGLPYRALFYVPQLKKMLYQVHDVPLSERPLYPTHREQVWLKLVEILKNQGNT